MASAVSQSSSAPRTCPCKNISWSLSSFTAAEYGDVNALSNALAKNKNSKRSSEQEQQESQQSSLINSGGITPLHLAAQHGHVAATWMLIDQGFPVDGGEGKGSTPLHRASFSGATATMRLLLETKRANLLARDTSFGDERTPLHKAAAGGRYLAVALLIDALREEGILQEGLQAVDRNKETPLQVAQGLQKNQSEERQGVARWDVVAGGSVADWDKVANLLSKAEKESQEGDPLKPPTSTNLPRHQFATVDCLDCEANGECVTASWTAAFQKALSQSISFPQSDKMKETSIREEQGVGEMKELPAETNSQGDTPALAMGEPSTSATTESTDAVGRACESCGMIKFALFPTPNGLLVCKKCKPKRREYLLGL